MTIFLSLIKISFSVLQLNSIDLNYIHLSEGIGHTKSYNSKECIFCHYWYFNHGFKFQNSVCNGCLDLILVCLSLSNIAIKTVKCVDYCCIIHGINKSESIYLLEPIYSVSIFLNVYSVYIWYI